MFILGVYMQQILASFSASISELKKNPTALLNKAEGETIAILNHNLPTAYLVPAVVYELLIDKLKFLPSAKKEWDELDNSIKSLLKVNWENV